MKYIKLYSTELNSFLENKIFESELNISSAENDFDFTAWCITQKNYAYNKDNNHWLDLKSFSEYLSWEDIYLVYKAEKYNL